MMKNYIGASLVVGLLLSATPTRAQFATQAFLPIPAELISDTEFLTSKKGKSITLAGELRLPKRGARLPAVILFHGAGGPGGAKGIYDSWVLVLNEAGIATFAVDSFAGRGLLNPPDGIEKVTQLSRVVDAFGALEVLGKHPAIDPKRIAIMGFSHGSVAALYSNLSRFQKMHGSPDVQLAAHISAYGNCTTTYRDDENITAPLLMLHGTADDLLPISPCRAYAERLSKAGKQVRFIEYAGAHHAYDIPAIKTVIKFPNGVSPRRCKFVEGDNGGILNVETNQPFTLADPCYEKGTTVAYDEVTMNKSHEDVKAFLREVFKLN